MEFLYLTKPSVMPEFKKEWMFICGIIMNEI